MYGYNTIEAQIYYPRYIYIYIYGRLRVHYKLLVEFNVTSVTGANYCPDLYLIMLVVRCLLTIMSIQRSSYIGRPQVEKHASLFVQA